MEYLSAISITLSESENRFDRVITSTMSEGEKKRGRERLTQLGTTLCEE